MKKDIKEIQFIDEDKISLITAVELMMPSVFECNNSNPFKMIILMVQQEYEYLTDSEEKNLNTLKQEYGYLLDEDEAIRDSYFSLKHNYINLPGRIEYQNYFKKQK